jgi:hypothetical protein
MGASAVGEPVYNETSNDDGTLTRSGGDGTASFSSGIDPETGRVLDEEAEYGDGSSSEIKYDENGNPVSGTATDGNGNEYRCEYDPETGEILGEKMITPEGVTTNARHNDDGTTDVHSADNEGGCTDAKYDEDGNLTEAESDNGQGQRYSYRAQSDEHDGKPAVKACDAATGAESTEVFDTENGTSEVTSTIPTDSGDGEIECTVSKGADGTPTETTVQSEGEVTLPNGETANVPVTTSTTHGENRPDYTSERFNTDIHYMNNSISPIVTEYTLSRLNGVRKLTV